MPLYKFYRIVPKDVSKTDCYIGHTTQPLRKRFSQHWEKRNSSRVCSSSMLFHNYGRDALEIVLIHELELPDKEFALREERRLYEEYRETVVNKNRPIITDEERKKANQERRRIHGKQWREVSKEHQAEYHKKWWKVNRERCNARRASLRAYDAGLKYFARITIE